jgi:hypothetical protein
VRYNPGIMAGLGAPPEIAALNRDNQRLTELKEFLARPTPAIAGGSLRSTQNYSGSQNG